MALNTTIDLESLTKPGNYIARYEPITSPAANVINLLMREDRACSMYEEESNGDFRELSLSDGHIWGVTQYGAESAGKRAAAGPRRPALNRHRGAGRRATLARRPLAHGGEPSDSSTPGSSPQVSPPRATAGQAPSTASLDFQPEAVYWFNQNAQVFTLRQHSQCLAGRVVRVNPDGIQWEWLYAPGVLVHRRRDSLDQQKPLPVSDSHRAFLAHDPTLTLRDVLFLIARGASSDDHTQLQFSPFTYDLKGFANTENQQHWTNMLN